MTGLVPASQIMNKIRAGEQRGLAQAAENDVLAEAKRNVPVDSGRLRDSGQVKPTPDGGVAVTFGEGLPDDRAVVVHEKTELHHGSGEAKYLERAMAARRAQVAETIANEIRKETS